MKTSTIIYIGSACAILTALMISIFILRNKYIKNNYGSSEHKKNIALNSRIPKTSKLYVDVSNLLLEDQLNYHNNGLILTR